MKLVGQYSANIPEALQVIKYEEEMHEKYLVWRWYLLLIIK